jgi:hypothetical protein
MNMNGILKTVTGGVVDAAWGIGGKAAARFGSTKFGMVPGSITASLVEAGIGVLGAMALRRVSPSGTRAFLQGAFMAPLETMVITAKVPFVSDYLGDYGTMALPMQGAYNSGIVNPARQVGMGGYPPRLAGTMAGYPPERVGHYDEGGMGDFDTMAGAYR